MTLRLPRLAGALALIALTLSFGEQLWALTCEASMDMPASAEMPMPGHDGHERDSKAPARDCPITLATGSCSATLLLSAAPVVAFSVPTSAAHAAEPAEQAPTSGLTIDVFRPPRT